VTARPLGGKGLAAAIRAEVTEAAATLTANGITPRLAVVGATADEASAWYARSIAAAAGKAGIGCDPVDLGSEADADAIRETLAGLSADAAVHGIVLQTPLPGGAMLAELASAIDPAKDVDGANPQSLGRLICGLPAFPPATASAVLALLDHHQVELEGRRAVVVGRSIVVGKPVVHLLLGRQATVTVCPLRSAQRSRSCRRPTGTGNARIRAPSVTSGA